MSRLVHKFFFDVKEVWREEDEVSWLHKHQGPWFFQFVSPLCSNSLPETPSWPKVTAAAPVSAPTFVSRKDNCVRMLFLALRNPGLFYRLLPLTSSWLDWVMCPHWESQEMESFGLSLLHKGTWTKLILKSVFWEWQGIFNLGLWDDDISSAHHLQSPTLSKC